MKVVVRFFASSRDLAGTDFAAVELPDGSTMDDLRRQLAMAYPPLAALLDRSALAVDDEFAAGSMMLVPGTEVALLPPVSGG